jgi:hypothetical protein
MVSLSFAIVLIWAKNNFILLEKSKKLGFYLLLVTCGEGKSYPDQGTNY